jgi:hypothetical protein
MGMRQTFIAAVMGLGSLSCASPPPAPAPAAAAPIAGFRLDASAPPVDRRGKGAVLCAWSLYVVAQEVGRRRHAGEDAAFQDELARSVARTDAFILRNSSAHPTPADLAARKALALRETPAAALCTGTTAELYDQFRKQGAAALRASTDDLLSVPREPVMNPCV